MSAAIICIDAALCPGNSSVLLDSKLSSSFDCLSHHVHNIKLAFSLILSEKNNEIEAIETPEKCADHVERSLCDLILKEKDVKVKNYKIF